MDPALQFIIAFAVARNGRQDDGSLRPRIRDWLGL